VESQEKTGTVKGIWGVDSVLTTGGLAGGGGMCVRSLMEAPPVLPRAPANKLSNGGPGGVRSDHFMPRSMNESKVDHRLRTVQSASQLMNLADTTTLRCPRLQRRKGGGGKKKKKKKKKKKQLHLCQQQRSCRPTVHSSPYCFKPSICIHPLVFPLTVSVLATSAFVSIFPIIRKAP